MLQILVRLQICFAAVYGAINLPSPIIAELRQRQSSFTNESDNQKEKVIEPTILLQQEISQEAKQPQSSSSNESSSQEPKIMEPTKTVDPEEFRLSRFDGLSPVRHSSGFDIPINPMLVDKVDLNDLESHFKGFRDGCKVEIFGIQSVPIINGLQAMVLYRDGNRERRIIQIYSEQNLNRAARRYCEKLETPYQLSISDTKLKIIPVEDENIFTSPAGTAEMEFDTMAVDSLRNNILSMHDDEAGPQPIMKSDILQQQATDVLMSLYSEDQVIFVPGYEIPVEMNELLGNENISDLVSFLQDHGKQLIEEALRRGLRGELAYAATVDKLIDLHEFFGFKGVAPTARQFVIDYLDFLLGNIDMTPKTGLHFICEYVCHVVVGTDFGIGFWNFAPDIEFVKILIAHATILVKKGQEYNINFLSEDTLVRIVTKANESAGYLRSTWLEVYGLVRNFLDSIPDLLPKKHKRGPSLLRAMSKTKCKVTIQNGKIVKN